MVDMQQVESSNIEAIGYDEMAGELVVQFKTGRSYRYSDIDLDEYNGLMESESKGRYFAQNIKGIYNFTEEE